MSHASLVRQCRLAHLATLKLVFFLVGISNYLGFEHFMGSTVLDSTGQLAPTVAQFVHFSAELRLDGREQVGIQRVLCILSSLLDLFVQVHVVLRVLKLLEVDGPVTAAIKVFVGVLVVYLVFFALVFNDRNLFELFHAQRFGLSLGDLGLAIDRHQVYLELDLGLLLVLDGVCASLIVFLISFGLAYWWL